MTGAAAPARNGRPTAEAAARLGEAIVEVATVAFLRDGYAATSIEAIAKEARVGKRTLYARFADKEALFGAVLERLMARWMAAPLPELPPGRIEPALVALAERMLAVALQPEALALHRILIAEGGRLPQLPDMLRKAGTNAGAAFVAALLTKERARNRLAPIDAAFAAEQFINLILSGPRRRALGLGQPFHPDSLSEWARQSVALFLHGWSLGIDRDNI